MGIRVNAYNLMSLRAITRDQRDNGNQTSLDMPTTAFEASLNPTDLSITDLTSVSSEPLPEPTTKLSNQLQRSLTLNSIDSQLRNFSTDGIGDRGVGVTSTTQPDAIDFTHPNSQAETADTAAYNIDVKLTQDDMTQIRESVRTIVTKYTLDNPTTTTTDDIKTEVDRYLGDGVSDLLNIRVTDLGAGKSAVQFGNLDTSNLTLNDTSLLVSASQNAKANFESVESPRALVGADVDQLTSKIGDLFNWQGTLEVNDFKAAIAKPGNFDAAADKLLEDSKDFLSAEDRTKLKSYLQELKTLDDQNLSSFDKNPLADDLSVSWTSTRFGPAWDSTTIDAQAELTNTPGWTTNTRLGITPRNKKTYEG